MTISIKNAIIHIMDIANGVPVLSNDQLLVDEDVTAFISDIIEKTFQSDDIKECTFREGASVWTQCKNAEWDLNSISQSIATNIYTIMRRNSEIPSADIVFGTAQINSTDYFFMLKLDYKSAFTHHIDTNNGNKDRRIDIIRYKTLLPTQTTKVGEGFFINMQNPCVKVVERKFTVDGIKDYYLSPQILACCENKTPRQKATKVLQVAEKVSGLYYAREDKVDTHISATMLDELQREQPLLVENLGRKFFPDNPVAQQEFFERLAASDISKDETLSLSEKFQKKFEKQAIRTTSGVEIKIPTQVYTNADEVEFINNPDGTVSLLIKNIKL